MVFYYPPSRWPLAQPEGTSTDESLASSGNSLLSIGIVGIVVGIGDVVESYHFTKGWLCDNKTVCPVKLD